METETENVELVKILNKEETPPWRRINHIHNIYNYFDKFQASNTIT